MRTVKFRAKRTDNGEFVFGHYFRTFEIGYHSQGYDDVPDRVDYILDDNKSFEINSDTLGEFTGLKDKNGKEIFEGDIVRAFGMHYEIVFEDGAFYLKKKNVHHRLSRVLIFNEGIEIIGNIHKNSELLK